MGEFINVTTKMFFDREKVADAMDRKSAKCLSSAGAFGRTVMKRGMRRRKGISDAGSFPSSHAGQLRDLIFFGYDSVSKSVVVGPTLFKKDRETTGTNKTVPQLLNEGGTVFRIRKVGRGGNTRTVGKHVRQTYRPRPFVELTRKPTADKLLENLANYEFK